MLFTVPVAGTDRCFAKDPCVIRWQDRYFLYFSKLWIDGDGRDRLAIGIAVSRDLENWQETGEIRAVQAAEGLGVGAPGAIVLDGTIHLFYQSYGQFPRDYVCHAESADGLTFERDATNPVVRPEGDWNIGRAIDADVAAFGEELLLYWATRDPEGRIQMLGVSSARRESGFHREDWTQRCSGPVLKPELPWEQTCIEAPAALVRDRKVYLFYAGAYNCSPQQIGCAVSEDGIRFRRLQDRPLLTQGREGTWNASESGHPYVFEDEDGKVHLFYQGSPDRGRNWFLSRAEVLFDDRGMPSVRTGTF